MDCCCGNNLSSKMSAVCSDKRSGFVWSTLDATSPIDASFVHLPSSTFFNESSTSMTANKALTPGNYLDSYKHLLLLERLARGEECQEPLCLNCMERVRRALEIDTDRLEKECQMYQGAIEDERWRQESTLRALRSVGTSVNGETDILTHEALLKAYRDEIEELKVACQVQQAENEELARLTKEQMQHSRDLDKIEWEMEEHRNALELESRGFDNAEEQARKHLSDTMAELDQLSSAQIRLPAILLDLKVDKERGLRYPLLNGLRLAYRPKGDVDKLEIQAAWALAAQLLFSCGILLQYQSQFWKIVPLSNGAKLVHYNARTQPSTSNEKEFTVYDLGHPKANSSQSLLAWNNLLHGVVHHALTVLTKAYEAGLMEQSSVPSLPFEMSPTSIGGISLLNLDANDDSGWSRVIHCSASNLLWLSECASRSVLAQMHVQIG